MRRHPQLLHLCHLRPAAAIAARCWHHHASLSHEPRGHSHCRARPAWPNRHLVGAHRGHPQPQPDRCACVQCGRCGWAVHQGRGHVLATWLAMAGPCCGGRALALRLDRGSGGASKLHPVTQEVVLDACTGHPTGIHESTGPRCRLWALLGGCGGPRGGRRTQKVAFFCFRVSITT